MHGRSQGYDKDSVVTLLAPERHFQPREHSRNRHQEVKVREDSSTVARSVHLSGRVDGAGANHWMTSQ